jgi:adenylate cyclase
MLGAATVNLNTMSESESAIISASRESVVFRATVGVGVIASLVSFTSGRELLNSTLIVGLLLVLVYLLTTAIIQRKYQDDPDLPKVLGYLGHADALLLGSFVALIDFSLLPTGIFFVMVQYRALANGGIQRWVIDNLAILSGVLLVFVFKEPTLQLELSSPVSSLVLLVFAVYFCVYGYFTYLRTNGLREQLSALEREQVRLKMINYQFSKYLSPDLRKTIEQGREVKLSTQRKRLVVFFSDIVGFSEIADEMDESALTLLINNYLTEMSKIALEFGGTIDKFIGDAVMVFFGDPTTKGPKDDCIACVSMALAMRRKSIELQARWKSDGLLKPLQMRMGISTGFCTVGNFGTETRLDYTLLGSEVNLASRLETSAKAGEILISQVAHEMIKDVILCEDRGSVEVKGFKSPIKVYAAIDFRKNLGKDEGFVDFTTNGFSLIMDAENVPNYEHAKILATLHRAIRHFRTKDPSP